MPTHQIHPVILCGGNGKRLWPLSRKSLPKQFARLTGDDSMLQATARRLEDCGCAAPLLMTSQDYRFLVAEQMEEMGTRGHQIVIEPESRNTAAAIAAAVEIIAAEGEDRLILVAPSDHHFHDVMAFSKATLYSFHVVLGSKGRCIVAPSASPSPVSSSNPEWKG